MGTPASGPGTTRARKHAERGFLLLGVFTTILIVGILSGIVIQDWSIVEKREREAQLLFVQEQYAAAIIAYQKGQGALPTELQQLTKKGQKGELYLRRPYTDPMFRNAKLEDWCLLKLAGTGQVASSCSAEGAADQAGDALNSGLSAGFGEGDGGGAGFGTKGGKSGASTGSKFDSAGKFGTANNPSSFGNLGQIGQESAGPGRQRNIPGLQPGTSGIVGVHSKSHDQAYNTVKRTDETYDKWYYTSEDYKKDVSVRNIPGMPPRATPGIGTNKTNQQNPFNNMGSSSGLGSGSPGSSFDKPRRGN